MSHDLLHQREGELSVYLFVPVPRSSGTLPRYGYPPYKLLADFQIVIHGFRLEQLMARNAVF